MTEYEICYNYRTAKYQSRQIQILADLNGTDSLQIIAVLVRNGEKLTDGTARRLYRQLDKLEKEIMERERKYREIAAALKGEKAR